MMDPRSRSLPSSSGLALAELPVEAPVDALAPGEPPALARATVRPTAASPPPAQAPAEEFVDPEKILLAGERPTVPKPVAPSVTSAAPSIPAAPPIAPPPQAQRGPELMDRDFIARNQVVERYLSGRLPIKGATDFERFCRDNPELLDELGIPERVNAALRLLEASGKPEPWAEPRKPFWQKLEIVLGLLGAALVLAAALAIVASGSSQKTRRIAALRQEATERPLDPATSTRDIRLLPSREGASDSPAIIIGGGS